MLKLMRVKVNRLIKFSFLILFLLACTGIHTLTDVPSNATLPQVTETQSNRQEFPFIFAHYMPWFQTPQFHSAWGWHWTMNHFNPEVMDENGRREIASYYYPMTGPYDSSDPHILEYQVLLMRVSGIYGVIVDWYGEKDFWDYGIINDSTHAIFNYIKRAGLYFVICYEDQSVRHMVDNDYLDEGQVYHHATDSMKYLESNFFSSETYFKIDNRPVLFIFGPQYFTNITDWDTIFTDLQVKPILVTLNFQVASVANGSFPWIPMELAEGNALSIEKMENYLRSFYQKISSYPYQIAGAWPGFHDIYQEAGLGYGYGYLDDRNGKTFKETLQLALQENPQIIQLITWNDYGEGTQIEPTQEYGNRYLEILLEAKKQLANNSLFVNPDDLQLPFELFLLREKYMSDTVIQQNLDRVFEEIVQGNIDNARGILMNIK